MALIEDHSGVKGEKERTEPGRALIIDLSDKKAAGYPLSPPLSLFIASLPLLVSNHVSRGLCNGGLPHIFFQGYTCVAPLTLYTNSQGTPNIKN